MKDDLQCYALSGARYYHPATPDSNLFESRKYTGSHANAHKYCPNPLFKRFRVPHVSLIRIKIRLRLEYTPGTCNIGREEIRRRTCIGYAGVAIALVMVGIISILDLPRSARLIIAVPVGISLAGFVQAGKKFCLAYGLRGVFSTHGLRSLSRVTSAENHIADRKTAVIILCIVVGGALLITAAYYFFP